MNKIELSIGHDSKDFDREKMGGKYMIWGSLRPLRQYHGDTVRSTEATREHSARSTIFFIFRPFSLAISLSPS